MQENHCEMFYKYGNTRTVEMLDAIKTMGHRFSTRGAISISVSDMEVPEKKFELIDEAKKQVEKYQKAFRRGLISNDERHEKVIDGLRLQMM